MTATPLPTNEIDRLEALRSFHILDTRPDPRFDRITDFAVRIFDAPVALVSLVDDCRAWFKAKHGIDTPESSRDAAFCAHAIMGGDVFVIEDMLQDSRFADHPLVVGSPHVRFYAGAPISDPNGFRLGTMCVMDFKPRTFGVAQQQMLAHLAAITYDELELHRALHDISEARQQLTMALRAKEDFFTMMGREIRTPLTGAVNQIDSLQATNLDFNQKRMLGELRQTTGGLLDVIGDILTFADLDAGRVKLETVDFNVTEVVDGVLGLLRPRAQGRGLALLADYRNLASTRLRADPGRIRHILFNLIGNAIKYTAAGSVKVLVSSYAAANGGYELRLEVVDTGGGIADNLRSRLLDPDYGFGTRDPGSTPGAGLGLPIVHRLLKMMSGRLAITDTPGGGSTVSVMLPVENVRAQAATAATVTAAANGGLTPLKLLVAEDNQVNQMVMKVALGRLGYTLHFANDGIEAVSAVQREHYDAVLMDVQMPEMDGVEATRRIRRFGGRYAALPIIALTSKSAAHRDELLAEGFSDFVGKPIDIALLLRILNDVQPSKD